MGENPLLGQFDVPVILEDMNLLSAHGSPAYECGVRLLDGAFENAVLSSEQTATIFSAQERLAAQPPDAERTLRSSKGNGCVYLLTKTLLVRNMFTHGPLAMTDAAGGGP